VFEPLGMTTTTFDFAKALKGDVAMPHGEDVDGKLMRAAMDLNYSVYPVRPAGGVWTSPRELAKYVEMELAKGLLPNGKRLVSAENLLARYEPNVIVGEDVTYGMALMVDTRYGIPVVHHGGDLAGYHSDMIWLPDHGVGAVILANSDSGVIIRGPLMRRLLEVLFDGKPEAEEALKVAAAQRQAAIAKQRERLTVPADRPRLLAARTQPGAGGDGVGSEPQPCLTPVSGGARSRRGRTTTGRSPSSRSIRRSAGSSSWSRTRGAAADHARAARVFVEEARRSERLHSGLFPPARGGPAAGGRVARAPRQPRRARPRCRWKPRPPHTVDVKRRCLITSPGLLTRFQASA
jgi:hypothetical protein